MATSAAVTTVGAGLGVKLGTGKVRASCATLTRAGEDAYMVYKISSLHYATGNKYLLMCLVSNLKVSSIV